MTIKKSHLEVFFNTLKATEGVLSLTEARIRDSFIKSLAEKTQVYFEDRNKIYTTFCKKNEDGSPALVEVDKYEFPKECLEEINKELITLAEEEVELEIVDKLKEIIEKSEYKPKVGEAEIIDEITAKL